MKIRRGARANRCFSTRASRPAQVLAISVGAHWGLGIIEVFGRGMGGSVRLLTLQREQSRFDVGARTSAWVPKGLRGCSR